MIFSEVRLTKLFLQRNLIPVFLLFKFYVDDIIFGSSDPLLYENFANLMKGEFEMSLTGDLSFFVGLQTK